MVGLSLGQVSLAKYGVAIYMPPALGNMSALLLDVCLTFKSPNIIY
jgi:hypothetical protein